MAVNPDEDTEFNDALRKYGIIPEKEAPPPSPSPPPSPTLEDLMDDMTLKQLQEFSDDTRNEDTARKIEAYRRQRVQAERLAHRKARFGRVYPIGREDYSREVTDSSVIDEDDDTEHKGTGVVCFLYKDGLPRSERTFSHIRTLATKYPRTKFVSIVGDKCIPNLPDSRIPMLIIYRKGEIRNQIIAWGSDRDRRLEELEAILLMTGGIDLPDVPTPSEKKDGSDFEDDDDDYAPDASSRMRSAATSTNGRAKKNVRSKDDDDDGDGSDFEFDL